MADNPKENSNQENGEEDYNTTPFLKYRHQKTIENVSANAIVSYFWPI
jgi:hypothetical protein